MFFILSSGRSGTKTISQVLSLIGGCACFHEPYPQLILESSAYRYGNISESTLSKILLQTRHPYIDSNVYCESNQTLSLFIPVLAKVFPKARFIWLIRNGLDVVASAYQKQWYSGHSENHGNYQDCPPIEKAWIDGRVEGDKCGDLSEDAWALLNRFGRCCWYWSYVNRVIEADLHKFADQRFRMIRLESLDHELPSLVEWMGLRYIMLPVAKRQNKAKREPYQWDRWTDEERVAFQTLCGELMDQYYPLWRSLNGDWRGVEYRASSGPLRAIRSQYRIVKSLNSIISRI